MPLASILNTSSTRIPTLAAAVALISASILIETAAAVEVSGGAKPAFLLPEQPSLPQHDSGSVPQSGMASESGPAPESGTTVAAPSKDCFILASRSFTIPFTVDESGARPVEVRLYVSHGPQVSWQMLSHTRPDSAKRQFEFTAQADGEYWFATRTIDVNGNQHPSNAIQPQLKVYVDTTKPVIDLTVDASAEGRVDATLAVDDATPIKELLVRYVTDQTKQWHSVDSGQLLTNGKIQFSPDNSWERISLQLVATDKAGNQTVVHRLLQRPRVAEVPANRYGANDTNSQSTTFRIRPSQGVSAHTVSNPVIRLDRKVKKPVEYQTKQAVAQAPVANYATGATATPFRGFRGVPAAGPATPFYSPAAKSTGNPAVTQFDSLFGSAPARRPNTIPAPTTLPAPATVSTPATVPITTTGPTPANGPVPKLLTAQQRADSRSPLPPAAAQSKPDELPKFGLNSPAQKPSVEQIPAPLPELEKRVEAKKPQPRTAVEAMRPLSEQSAVPEKIPAPKPKRARVKRPAVAEVPRAPIRHSDSERFSLEYELQAVGNLGVDAIELYGSVDGGDTWDLWGTDPDRVSPFDIETKEEGVFSFRIVVVGRNGLASPRPQKGETPDIVVVVDKVKPQVRITAAQYGEGNRIGALVIRYECLDSNLGARPISLSFSDTINGPWTTIAAGLRNDGDYVWPADPKLPRQIYLRIDCKDEAGNVGTYVLDKPIDVQGLAPRAKIRGFQSLSGMEALPVDEQTAERPRASFK
jgi:hypothetical protein